MSHFDHSDLDGHLLGLLVAVHEEGSVTRAAQRLGLTQSAVSHGLDKLRAIVGDPLFIRAGRGIVPTARAEAQVRQARQLLEALRSFASTAGFDPARQAGTLTVAANDLQRELLLPPMLQRLRTEAPRLSLRVIPSGVPTPEMLRDGHCDLVLTPRPPDAADLVQRQLFEDHYLVYYDAAQREAPRTLASYLAAEHVTVVYEPRRPLDLDQALAARGVARRFAASVPGLAGVAGFVRGTPWLATAPSLLAPTLMHGLASAPPPLPCPSLPMYMVWHARHQADPMHRWVREAIDACVPSALRPALPHARVCTATPEVARP